MRKLYSVSPRHFDDRRYRLPWNENICAPKALLKHFKKCSIFKNASQSTAHENRTITSMFYTVVYGTKRPD